MAGSYGGGAYGAAAYTPVVAQSGFSGTMPYSVITEIAFASNPLDDPAVWTDVSQYVVSIQTNRGRQHELNRFEAGTATVTLKNLDGRFSPFNTSSPYNPNILPYKQIRVRALYNGVYYPIFRGHINSWPVKWPSPADSTVSVQATDAFKLLNLKKATNLSSYSSTILADTPSLYYKINETGQGAFDSTVGAFGAALVPIIDYGSSKLNNVAVVAAGVTPGTSAFLGAAGAIVASTDTSLDCGVGNGQIALLNANPKVPAPPSFNCGGAWSMECWCLVRALQKTDMIPIAAVGGVQTEVAILVGQNTNGGLPRLYVIDDTGANSQTVSSYAIADSKWHHLVVTAAAGGNLFSLYVDGQLACSAGAPSAPISVTGTQLSWASGLNGQIAHAAFYSSALSATQVLNHYKAGVYPLTGQTAGTRIASLLGSIGWPSTLQSLDTGTISLQPGSADLVNNSALANAQVASDSELGELFVSGAGAVVFYDHSHKYKVPNTSAAAVLGDSGTLGPGGESPYLLDSVDIEFDDLDIYNQASVTPAGQGAQVANDTASQTAYGIRTTSTSGLQAQPTDALNEANWLVGKYKTPLQRIRSVTFTPMSDPTVLLPAALGFELLTRITLRRRPLDGAGSTFAQDSLIEGVSHTITPGMWQTTWALSPTDASPAMGIFNQPTSLFGSAVFGF